MTTSEIVAVLCIDASEQADNAFECKYMFVFLTLIMFRHITILCSLPHQQLTLVLLLMNV